MAVVDFVAWQLVRVLGLIQFVVGYTIGLFYHPSPCSHSPEERSAFQLLMSMQFGGSMMMQSKSPSDFPKVMSDKMLMLGRIWLAVIVFQLAWPLMKEMVKRSVG